MTSSCRERFIFYSMHCWRQQRKGDFRNLSYQPKQENANVSAPISSVCPLAGIEPTPLRCRCNSLTTTLRRQLHDMSAREFH